MPDLAEELRRYADAVEESMPSRPIPQPSRFRRRRGASGIAAIAAIAAATIATLVWVDSRPEEAATIGTTDEAPVSGDWSVETLGVLDVASGLEPSWGQAPAWFRGRWWAMAPSAEGGVFLTSGDGVEWGQFEGLSIAGDPLTFGGLVTNDSHLMVTAIDDRSDTVNVAVTTDGSRWKTATVASTGIDDAANANVVAVAFDDALGVAIKRPTAAAVDLLAASSRLQESVSQRVGAESYSYQIDVEQRAVSISGDENSEIDLVPMEELGLTSDEIDLIITDVRIGSPSTAGSWELWTSVDGDDWQSSDLPADIASANGFAAQGRALVTHGETAGAVSATVDGLTWHSVDDPESPRRGDGHLLATSASDLWFLPALHTDQPAERSSRLGAEFTQTSLRNAIAVARSQQTTALLIDATPADPFEQSDLEAQYGWATAPFTWTDGTFRFEGSYMSGGTFTDERDGRSWAITYDDLVGAGDKVEVPADGSGKHFLDPDTGEELVTIRDEFRDAIAEQHPQWADAVRGETVPDTTPAPDRQLRVALFDAGATPEYIDLPPQAGDRSMEAFTTLSAGPDGSFLVIAATDFDGDPRSFQVSEWTVYLIDRSS